MFKSTSDMMLKFSAIDNLTERVYFKYKFRGKRFQVVQKVQFLINVSNLWF